jgi:hypothetical protein
MDLVITDLDIMVSDTDLVITGSDTGSVITGLDIHSEDFFNRAGESGNPSTYHQAHMARRAKISAANAPMNAEAWLFNKKSRVFIRTRLFYGLYSLSPYCRICCIQREP